MKNIIEKIIKELNSEMEVIGSENEKTDIDKRPNH